MARADPTAGEFSEITAVANNFERRCFMFPLLSGTDSLFSHGDVCERKHPSVARRCEARRPELQVRQPWPSPSVFGFSPLLVGKIRLRARALASIKAAIFLLSLRDPFESQKSAPSQGMLSILGPVMETVDKARVPPPHLHCSIHNI